MTPAVEQGGESERRRARRHAAIRAQTRTAQVQGIAPRSQYTPSDEAAAWTRALEAARGNIRAVPVLFGRKRIGVVQGRSPHSDDVRGVRLREGASRAEAARIMRDLEDTRRLDSLRVMPFADENEITDSTTSGKYGRTIWSKVCTTAGVANNWYDLWRVSGNPTSGLINGTARTAVRFDEASTGAIGHRGNVSTDTKHILSMLATASANTPTLVLYDRVIAYDQCSISTSNQTMTNTLTAQRYNSGAPGLLPVMCTNTVLSATASNLTQFRYTDDAANATQSMPTGTTVSLIVSSAAPTANLGARIFAPSTSANTVVWGYHLPLANGDNGVQLVEDYTWSANNTGTFTLVLLHPLAEIILPTATVSNEVDYVHQIAEAEQIYDGACLSFLSYFPATTAHTVGGNIRYGWHA